MAPVKILSDWIRNKPAPGEYSWQKRHIIKVLSGVVTFVE